MTSTKYIRGAGGGGGGKGGGGQHTPTEADDSLQSVQYANVVDLLSEGEIEGMDTGAVPGDGEKSIFLDSTPVRDSSGNANFDGYSCQTRVGTQNQTYVSELASNESETNVSVQVTNSSSVTRQITQNTTDRVRVTIRIPALRIVEEDGDIVGHSVRIKILRQYNGGGYQTVKDDTISGKASTAYLRDYIIETSGAFPVDIRVERVSADETSTRRSNQTWWSSYTTIIDEKLRYPNSALAYLRFDSRQFNNIPTRKYLIRGIKVKVPSNASVDTSTHIGRVTYSGVWNGSWSSATWCNDPAWCLYDLLTDTRYGVGLPESSLDKWDFYAISQYCNELVSDGKGSQEPRFACNLLINTRQEVYNIIQQMTALFRGMTYYGAGSLVCLQDKPVDAQYLLGTANVVDGVFEYSGTSQKARHSTATVAYQTYDAQGEVQFEYVEDAEAVENLGIQNKDVKALGCYSQGQAHRAGLWLLKSEQLLTQTISFAIAIESGIIIRPGMVVDIADPVKSGTRRFGRISSATTTAVTIDSTTNLSVNLGNSPTISCMMPTGIVEKKSISGISGRVVSITGTFSEAPNAESTWLIETSDVQAQQFRVISVTETDAGIYGVTALQYNASIFGNIDSGDDVVLRDISNLTAAPDPVTNVEGNEFLYSDGQGVFVGVDLSWKSPRTRVSEFRIQYKMDQDNWQLVTTSSPSVTLRNMRAGTLSTRITTVNYLGRGSTVVTFSQSIAGKTAAPEDVQGLMMIPSTSGLARLFWTQCADLDVIVGGWARVRHSPSTSNVTWATSTSIHADLPGSAKEAYVDLKAGTYLMKFIDSGGRQSVNASLVEFTKPDLDQLEGVNTQTEHPSFAGTKTDLAVDSGTNELRMAPDGGTEGGNATFETSGTYMFNNNPIDLGGIYSVRLQSTIKVRSYFPYNPFVDTFANWDTLPSVDGDTPQDCDVKLYIRTTQVASPGNSDWTSWRLFHNAEFSARKYELKAECTTGGKLEQIAIQQLKVETLAAVRSEHNTGTSSSSGDLTVNFANAFLAAPSIGISFSASATGEYYKIPTTTSTGFTISIYNSSNTRQARAFQWTATGYGKA
jgi:predicted phage tail protein